VEERKARGARDGRRVEYVDAGRLRTRGAHRQRATLEYGMIVVRGMRGIAGNSAGRTHGRRMNNRLPLGRSPLSSGAQLAAMLAAIVTPRNQS